MFIHVYCERFNAINMQKIWELFSVQAYLHKGTKLSLVTTMERTNSTFPSATIFLLAIEKEEIGSNSTDFETSIIIDPMKNKSSIYKISLLLFNSKHHIHTTIYHVHHHRIIRKFLDTIPDQKCAMNRLRRDSGKRFLGNIKFLNHII